MAAVNLQEELNRMTINPDVRSRRSHAKEGASKQCKFYTDGCPYFMEPLLVGIESTH